MRRSFVLLAGALALLGLGGCRDLGGYLSEEELEACTSGARTEGCPPPEASTESRFTLPEFDAENLYPAGDAVPDHIGRLFEFELAVHSERGIARVDLSCGGLQLASWRIEDRAEVATLQGTVDLLPCRSSSTPEDRGTIEVHTIPLEIRVLDVLDGQDVNDRYRLKANLRDGRVPETRLPLEVSLDVEPGLDPVVWGGRTFSLLVRPEAGGEALAEAPQLWLRGVRVEGVVARTSTEDGEEGRAWVLEVPNGISSKTPGARRLDALLAPRLASLEVTGVTRSGDRTLGRVELLVERDRTAPPDLEGGVEGLNWWSPAMPIDHPVAIPVTSENRTLGTLVRSSGASYAAALFREDDQWTEIGDAATSSHSLMGFTARGELLWEVPGTGYFLQPDPENETQNVPFPGSELFGGTLFRLGNGSICNEGITFGGSFCEEGPTFWQISCMTPGAAGTSPIVTALPTFEHPRGAPWATVGLERGWISIGYGDGTPGCLPSQAVGAWEDALLEHSFSNATFNEALASHTETTVVLPAGPSSVVVGHHDDTGFAHFEWIDVALGNFGAETYFRSPAALPDAWTVPLWADAEGGLVLLRHAPNLDGDSVLERWLPGAAAPFARFNLTQWVGGDRVLIPLDQRPGSDVAIAYPRVLHGDGNVTVVLVRQDPAYNERPLAIEFTPALEPVWAAELPSEGEEGIRGLTIVGRPDGPYVDIVVWSQSQPDGVLYRWAR